MADLLVSEVTELEIENWKKKHKRVKQIVVEDREGKKHDFIIGRPTLSHIDMIASYLNDNKFAEYRKVMRNSCVLAGDKTVLDNDDDVRTAVFTSISDMMNEKLEKTEKEL